MSDETSPWSFAGNQLAQRRAIAALSFWQRLCLHDELLEQAELFGGERLRRNLREAPLDRRRNLTGPASRP